MNEFFKLK